jgi:hypothetical protein
MLRIRRKRGDKYLKNILFMKVYEPNTGVYSVLKGH